MKNYIAEHIQDAIGGILEDYAKGRQIDNLNALSEPDKRLITQMTDQLFNVVYPGYFRDRTYHFYEIRNHLTVKIEDIAYQMARQISNCIQRDAIRDRLEKSDTGEHEDDDILTPEEIEQIKERAEKITVEFFSRIPYIRKYLDTDLEAFYDGDPAAENLDEIILCYPGFYAITVFRMAHELYVMGVPMLPRIMTEYAHAQTGIDINPGAVIGRYFFIDHGTGIVIGETTVIGEHVKVYQGVTLGALSTKGGRKLQNRKRHPTIEDHVTIYSGASILGGETVIGRGSIIGGNVFITSSIAPGTRVSVKNQELRFDQDKKMLSEIEQKGSEVW